MNRIRRALRAARLAFRDVAPSIGELREVWPQKFNPAGDQDRNLYGDIYESRQARLSGEAARRSQYDATIALDAHGADWKQGTRVVQEPETGAWREAEAHEYTPLVVITEPSRLGVVLIALRDAMHLTMSGDLEDETSDDAAQKPAA